MTSSWIQIDDLRESYLFLHVGTETGRIDPVEPSNLSFWECGIANPENLVQTHTKKVGYEGIASETDLITALMNELDQYRLQGTVLITPSDKSLQRLRREVTQLHKQSQFDATDGATLRGFRHISIETQLTKYFDQSLADRDLDPESLPVPRRSEANSTDVVSTGTVRELWECWQQLFRLLPANELTGVPL